ncbi:MAG: ADP-ribosylglycohydrolase family protein [Saprospiraceae bacterium]
MNYSKRNFSENNTTMDYNKVEDALLGVAVGDALGVPFEFCSSDQMKQNPAKGMIGFGRYNVPAGTWSDDSSLTFCLADSLLKGYDLADMANNFIQWRDANFWTARGYVFDIGITTSDAITSLKKILKNKEYNELTQLKYLGDEYDNGNGSLMRIMPLLFYIKGMDIAQQFELIRDVSALTHRHIRATMCCLIYLRLAEHLLNGKDKVESYLLMQKEILAFWEKINFSANESKLFIRLIEADIRTIPITELKSGGYVMESIETSIWCFLQRDTYSEVVLTAINLGHDTDTTAAIAGGLAGLYYGATNIPDYWLAAIARFEDIMELGEELSTKYL